MKVMAHKYKHYLIVLLVSSVLVFLMLAITAVVAITFLVIKPSPFRAFRRFVYDPIPKSVKDIKMDHHFELIGHRYILYFHINEADLSPILNSRPFKEVQYVEYTENGLLLWGDHPIGIRHSLLLYRLHSGETVPDWFRLDQWDSPKVYVVWSKRYRLRLLVYNKELSEAYFIDYLGPD